MKSEEGRNVFPFFTLHSILHFDDDDAFPPLALRARVPAACGAGILDDESG
jgi:hypothetical protein